jgi:Tfp pilus assembly major pilin PilA
MTAPFAIPPATTEAEAALARFQAQWPLDRCRRLRNVVCGTPAEKAAAEASYVADALARAETTADRAVVGRLSENQWKLINKGLKAFNRENRA